MPRLPGLTPATVNRHTGEVYLSAERCKEIPEEHLKFILLHELGHLVKQTTNEMIADDWAFNEYIRQGGSLTQSVRALADILSGKSPEHSWRTYLQYTRAMKYDCSVNGNVKACNEITRLSDMCTTCDKNELLDGYQPKMIARIAGVYSDFTGPIAGETAKQYRKRIKAEAAAKAKEDRAAGFRAKREAKVVAAQTGNVGPSVGSQINQGLQSVGGIVSSIFGGGGAAADDGAAYASEDMSLRSEQKSNKTILFVGIGVGAMFLFGLIDRKSVV